MGIIGIAQPACDRRAACCLFIGATLSFDILCSSLPGEVYYFAAAANAAACIELFKLFSDDWIVRTLECFCLISIILNFSGWIAYERSMPAAPYNMSYEIFYISAIFVLIIGGPAGGLFQRRGYVPRVLLHSD